METQTHIRLKELIMSLERRIAVMSEEIYECCSITQSQCHSLLEIGRSKGISIVELADRLGLDNSTISRSVDGLVRQGLVSRVEDPDNRRYVLISLTQYGKEVFEALEAGSVVRYRQLLNEIPKDKQETVLESIQLILDAFAALEKER